MSSYICEHTNELGTRVVARVGGATLERRHGTPILQALRAMPHVMTDG
jgi:hypothetical protein